MLLFLNIKSRALFAFPVILLLLVPHIAISQPDSLWSRTYGGLDTDVIICTRQTTDGGFISTGYSCVERNDFTQSYRDIWLFKTNSQGDVEWTRLYGFAGNDTGNWVEQTSDGGYIVGGVVRVASANASDPTLEERLFAMKTDDNGEQEWWYTYDNPSGPSVCTCIKETSEGGYIVLGAFENDVTTDVAMIKLDSQGQEEWIRNYNGTWEYYDTPHYVEQTPDNGYIITGYYAYLWTWDESSLFLMKTDETGEEEWTQYYGSDGYDIGYCVHHLDGNGYIVVGSYEHWESEQDLWLLRTDKGGNQIWSKRFGGADNDYGYNVEVTEDNHFFATGSTEMGAGGKDVYAVKVDFTGELVWQVTFGGAGDDVGGCGQQLDGRDGYIMSGYTYSFSGNDYSDGWLIRLDSDLGIENSDTDFESSLSTFPSPFSSILNIDLLLPSNTDIAVKIFGSSGRLIDTVFQGVMQQGTSSLQWTTPESTPSGCYLVHLQSGSHSITRKCVLLR